MDHDHCTVVFLRRSSHPVSWVISHLHPAIIHFPIALFLLTATARAFSERVPAPLIRLGLVGSIVFGLLALVSGLLAAQPHVIPPDLILTWHLRLASLWLACVLYLYWALDHHFPPAITTTLWIMASILLVAVGTLGGAMVHG